MRTKEILMTAAVAMSLGAFTAPAAEAAFDPVRPGVASRPAILLETNYYVYGPDTGFSAPELNLTLDNRSYSQPATMYLFWENRESGARLYYNLNTGTFGSQERDLFGSAGPAKVFVPDFDEVCLFGPGCALGATAPGIPTGTGLYQFILEIRDENGSQVIARSNAMYSHVNGVVDVVGDIDGTTNWTNDNAYYLQGAPTFVNPGGVLNIEEGTVILGSEADQGTLVVAPGATINAEGTSDAPIVFTSEKEVGQRGPGDWGGLVISGNAPVSGGQRQGEGNSGTYGGNSPGDSSGILRYVRVEFAGIRFSEQNELNGIALQGVGTGTVLENLQVHHNNDDGIEFFGGTANAKFVLITDANDDSLDWTFGWQGKLQHFVAIQRSLENDHGIEADNDEDNFDHEPRSNPTIYNATFVGNGPIAGSSEENGVLFRRGTFVTMRNFIITNFDDEAVEIPEEGIPSLGTGIVLSHGVISGNGGIGDPQAVVDYLQGQPGMSFESPRLPNPNSRVQPDVAPLNGSPARTNAAAPPSDGFFQGVSYQGGVNPNDSWIDDGWTTFSDN